MQWGGGGDLPVPGDYDADGWTDLAVFRPSTATWYVLSLRTGATTGVPFGVPTDVPVPGDYDGDRRTDIAVFRPSNGTWYLWLVAGITTGVQWGGAGDVPIIAR